MWQVTGNFQLFTQAFVLSLTTAFSNKTSQSARKYLLIEKLWQFSVSFEYLRLQDEEMDKYITWERDLKTFRLFGFCVIWFYLVWKLSRKIDSLIWLNSSDIRTVKSNSHEKNRYSLAWFFNLNGSTMSRFTQKIHIEQGSHIASAHKHKMTKFNKKNLLALTLPLSITLDHSRFCAHKACYRILDVYCGGKALRSWQCSDYLNLSTMLVHYTSVARETFPCRNWNVTEHVINWFTNFLFPLTRSTQSAGTLNIKRKKNLENDATRWCCNCHHRQKVLSLTKKDRDSLESLNV